jgi:hypothetical protein
MTSGGIVGAELVGVHSPGRAALLPQQPFQQAFSGLGIAAALYDLIEHIAILINRPPQPVFLAGNGDHDFVEMPDITTVRSLAPEAAGVVRPNFRVERRTVS